MLDTVFDQDWANCKELQLSPYMVAASAGPGAMGDELSSILRPVFTSTELEASQSKVQGTPRFASAF